MVMDLNMREKAMLCDILMYFISLVFIIQQEMQYTQSKTQYLFYNHNQLHVSANDDSHHQADHKKINRKCLQLQLLL